MKKSTKKITLFVTLGLFVLTGTYNALVINADSDMKDMTFTKRLDEVYGVVKEGRRIAGHSSWQKITAARLTNKVSKVEKVTEVENTTVESVKLPEPAVQEELSLNLVEVTHPSKWQQGLKNTDFKGSLSTNNGVIEELNVSLPGNQSISASFAEMSGNIFEYEMNGEIFSGLMYQVNQNAYMVTLTTGPLEGTRLRFSTTSTEEEQLKTQEALAQNNIEVGSFGSEPRAEEMAQNDEVNQEVGLEAQSFNLSSPKSL